MAGPYLVHQQASGGATTEVIAGSTSTADTKARGTNQVVYLRGVYLQSDTSDATVDIKTKNSAGSYTSVALFRINGGTSDNFYIDEGIRLKRGMQVVSSSGITNCVITYTV
jgi:hypothetical protein